MVAAIVWISLLSLENRFILLGSDTMHSHQKENPCIMFIMVCCNLMRLINSFIELNSDKLNAPRAASYLNTMYKNISTLKLFSYYLNCYKPCSHTAQLNN